MKEIPGRLEYLLDHIYIQSLIVSMFLGSVTDTPVKLKGISQTDKGLSICVPYLINSFQASRFILIPGDTCLVANTNTPHIVEH